MKSFSFGLALAVLACGPALARKKTPPAPPVPTVCSDFYQVGNADWLASHPAGGIGEASRLGELNALARQQVVDLLARTETSVDTPAAKALADLLASGKDPATRTLAVRATAAPLLARIDSIHKARDLAQAITALQLAGVPVLFDVDARRDGASDQAIAVVRPSALGLPGPEYYGRNEPALGALLGQYRQSLVDLLGIAGALPARAPAQADAALALETSLAAIAAGDPEQRLAVAEFDRAFPSLRLTDTLAGLEISPEQVAVVRPGYFRSVEQMLAKPDLARWQAFLRVRLMQSLAEALAEDPRRPYLATLGKAPAESPSARLADWIQGEGGELLDLAYADSFVGQELRQQALEVAEAVRAALARAIDRAAWLSDDGKASARARLAATQLAVGGAGVPAGTVGLLLDRDNLAANLLGVRRWIRARSLARLQLKPWSGPIAQTRPIVGYDATGQRVVVTAAALQPPLFARNDPASRFGSLGALVGQQLQLALGNFAGSDGTEWGRRTAGLVGQYAAYPANAGMRVDGLHTQRMNAADLAGLELAWDAYKNGAGADAPGDQDFFRAWAAIWAQREGAPAPAGSVFAPARWRVDGPLANLPVFAQAFGCRAGQGMVRGTAEQASLWR